MKEKIEIPDWLKSLQENSWELELFISGGAIFTLFKVSEYLIQLSLNIGHVMILPGRSMILFIVVYAVKLLTFGFVFHLLLRAFWVAMVFVNFVYPQGVRSDKIRWKKPFKVDLDERSDLYKPIMAVDKLSGIVMFLSIMSTFILFGLIFLIIVFLIILFSGLLPDQLRMFLLNYVFLTSFILYFIDLLSFGMLRRVPILSYIVFPFFKLYDYLSFRFIFDRALLTYGTNINRWRAFLFSTVFAFAALVATYISVQKPMHWPNVFDQRSYRFQMATNPPLDFYEDESDDLKVSIPSKIISDNFLDVKVAYWVIDNVMIEKLEKPENEKLFSDILQLRIDDSVYADVKWFSYYDENDRYGIEALLPISNLSKGEHSLYIDVKPELIKYIAGDRRYRETIVIPFWKNE